MRGSGRLAVATVRQYRSVRRRLIDHFGPIPLAAIRPRHIAAYIAETSGTHGASVVGCDVDLLHAVFKSAVKEEPVEANPATGAERPKLPRRKWAHPGASGGWPRRAVL